MTNGCVCRRHDPETGLTLIDPATVGLSKADR